MPLESLRQSPGEHDISMRDITLPEVEKPNDLPFDPDRDITNRDRECMLELLRVKSENSKVEVEELFANAVDFKLLDVPVHRIITDEYFEKAKENLHQHSYGRRVYAEFASDTKLLFPHRYNELTINKSIYNRLKGELDIDRADGRWAVFLNLAASFHLLFPEKNIAVDSTDEEKIIAYINSINNHQAELFRNLRFLRIGLPNSFSKIEIQESDWGTLQEQLNTYRQAAEQLATENNEVYRAFGMLAANMKIVAASEVNVADNGLIITMRKAGSISTPSPMPPQRNF